MNAGSYAEFVARENSFVLSQIFGSAYLALAIAPLMYNSLVGEGDGLGRALRMGLICSI
jgi:hypothetical protein